MGCWFGCSKSHVDPPVGGPAIDLPGLGHVAPGLCPDDGRQQGGSATAFSGAQGHGGTTACLGGGEGPGVVKRFGGY